MNLFTKRLLLCGVGMLGFASVALALSQAVSYQPWGVPESRRDDYENKLAELDRRAELRAALADRPRPIVEAALVSRDLGWLTPGVPRESSFELKNVGARELTLQTRDSSCDCLQATLVRGELPPGASTSCVVRWVPQSESPAEQRQQSVTILTNDRLQPTLTLTVAGRMRQPLVLPDKLAFGAHDLQEASTVNFLIYSQLHPQVDVEAVQAEGFDVQWSAEPVAVDDAALAGKAATAATRLILQLRCSDYGKYEGNVELSLNVNGVPQQAAIPLSGRVRPPIGFYGPEVDQRTGIDFGTLEGGKQHDLFVTVRSRADTSRRIEVLDLYPKALEAELTPLKTPGSYRLRVSVPADCPDRRFNLDSHRGYVQVGDPDTPSYASWLPVYGAVANTRSE